MVSAVRPSSRRSASSVFRQQLLEEIVTYGDPPRPSKNEIFAKVRSIKCQNCYEELCRVNAGQSALSQTKHDFNELLSTYHSTKLRANEFFCETATKDDLRQKFVLASVRKSSNLLRLQNRTFETRNGNSAAPADRQSTSEFVVKLRWRDENHDELFFSPSVFIPIEGSSSRSTKRRNTSNNANTGSEKC